MRILLIATAAGALIATAFPAAAAVQSSAPRARADAASAPQVNEEDPERRICVAVELTGSRMVRRVCRTQREWDARGGLENNR